MLCWLTFIQLCCLLTDAGQVLSQAGLQTHVALGRAEKPIGSQVDETQCDCYHRRRYAMYICCKEMVAALALYVHMTQEQSHRDRAWTCI